MIPQSFCKSCFAIVALLLGLFAGSLPRPALAQASGTLPVLPVIPAGVFVVTNYGAVGDGTTLNTTALQSAINACLQAGGGTVEVPAGTFLTGALTLGSNLDLQLDAGATILFSNNVSDFPVTNSRYQNCLSAQNCHDLAITGTGTIDGQGKFWWDNDAGNSPIHRPYMIQILTCTRLLVQGVTLQNSPMFHLVPDTCQEVTIQSITIKITEVPSPFTGAPNTDGIDPSGWDFLIQNCTIDTGDDNIALKPSHLVTAGQPSCKNFLIQNCTFLHGHGMSIGGQTPGGLDGMTVQNCTFNGTVAGVRMKAPRGSGGLVQNLTYNNLTMTNVVTPIQITSYYPSIPSNLSADPAQPVTSTTPIWQNINISNVTATGATTDAQILGLPEMPVSNITLTNVRISGKAGVTIAHARSLQFAGFQYANTSGAPLTLIDAQVTTVNPTVASVKATPQAWAGTGAMPALTCTLTPTGTTIGIALSQTLIPAADGTFTLNNIPAGTYTLGIKGSKWLRKDVAVDTTGGSVSGLSVTLLGGDADGNNKINATDYLMLRKAYNTVPGDANYEPRADFDGNGKINATDYLILRQNYNKVGDP